MKTEIRIENCIKPYCTIHTSEQTDYISQIAEKINLLDCEGNQININGWDGDFCIPLKPSQIYRIFSQDKKIFAQTENETFLVKQRLYEFEDLIEKCGLSDFVRISNTDIINSTHVKKFDMSFTGVIKVIFSNETSTIVSRRYMNKIRSQLCLKK